MAVSIVAVSDIHLGYRDQTKQDLFLDFIHACEDSTVDHLVLAGDIIDMWRRRNIDIFSCDEGTSEETAKKIRTNAKILDKLARMNIPTVTYVVGNHDFELIHMNKNRTEDIPFPITLSARIYDGKNWNTFLHGHQLDVIANMEGWGLDKYEYWAERLCSMGDMTGGLASSFWSITEKIQAFLNAQVRMMVKNPGVRDGMDRVYSFANSKGAYLYLGINPDDRLIYGHTHEIDRDINQKVANTGCWGWPNKEGKRNSYLTIVNGTVTRRFYDGGSIVLQ